MIQIHRVSIYGLSDLKDLRFVSGQTMVQITTGEPNPARRRQPKQKPAERSARRRVAQLAMPAKAVEKRRLIEEGRAESANKMVTRKAQFRGEPFPSIIRSHGPTILDRHNKGALSNFRILVIRSECDLPADSQMYSDPPKPASDMQTLRLSCTK
jgi:hypothetical protein